MKSSYAATRLMHCYTHNDIVKIRRLKQRLGNAYNPLVGLYSGYYILDLSNEMDRLCLKKLIEKSVKNMEIRRKAGCWDTSQVFLFLLLVLFFVLLTFLSLSFFSFLFFSFLFFSSLTLNTTEWKLVLFPKRVSPFFRSREEHHSEVFLPHTDEGKTRIRFREYREAEPGRESGGGLRPDYRCVADFLSFGRRIRERCRLSNKRLEFGRPAIDSAGRKSVLANHSIESDVDLGPPLRHVFLALFSLFLPKESTEERTH
jgi:hypothetical protein